MTRIKPADELATTLSTLTLFHAAVQHADDKARTIVAIQTMLMATVAAQFALATAQVPERVAQLVILAIFVPGYIQSSCQLLRALLPRITRMSAHNQFSFPSVADSNDVEQASVQEQCTNAREVGRVLANLAMVKHQHIRRAMYGTCALFAGTLCSLVLTIVG